MSAAGTRAIVSLRIEGAGEIVHADGAILPSTQKLCRHVRLDRRASE